MLPPYYAEYERNTRCPAKQPQPTLMLSEAGAPETIVDEALVALVEALLFQHEKSHLLGRWLNVDLL